MSDDYSCSRCGAAYKWEQLRQTNEGNLFCSACWQKIDAAKETKRMCPVDGTEMHKRLIAGMALIDRCPSCSGTWFDKYELEVIQKEAERKGWNSGFILGVFLG